MGAFRCGMTKAGMTAVKKLRNHKGYDPTRRSPGPDVNAEE